jgi:UDP-N-acetylmuramoyl-L-alanyl-D-glutamate--2,6-diaminopimelate ligase
MKLKDVLKNIEYTVLGACNDIEVNDIFIHSKNVKKNSIFVAIKGFKEDGHRYIRDAISRGATVLVLQDKQELGKDVIQIIVKDTRKALPAISKNFFKDPTRDMKIFGVTGTNGKTTTVFLLDSIFRANDLKTSMITTVDSFMEGRKVEFNRTTPESLDLNRFFFGSRNANVKYLSMELSSHAIDLGRVDHIYFNCFVFTNLTQDHLDYHMNMENYFEVKKRLFIKQYRDLFQCGNAVINEDDEYGRIIIKDTDLNTITFSILSENADVYAYDIANEISGIEMCVKVKGFRMFKVKSNLCGFFNVYNILASIGAAIVAGIDPEVISKGIKDMTGVNGRFEKIENKSDFTAIVDYAHTPDGLENVLKTARSLLRQDAKLFVLFGCGGDRDKSKREEMGKIAAQYADHIILTSDNPRSEDPVLIVDMIEKGLLGFQDQIYDKIIDRKEAINMALDKASANDIVLIAGKGHEDYQEFSDHRIHFSDQEIVRQWFLKKGLLG